MSRVQTITKILRELQSTADVEASAVVSDDGLMIASALPRHIEETRVAGMSATLSGLGTRASRELGRGGLRDVIIRGDNGIALMVNAGPRASLLVLAQSEAELSPLLLDSCRAAANIQNLL